MSEISFAPASKKHQMMLTTNTDVTIVGGAAGSGKSYVSIILRHLRFVDDPNYRGYIIRKNDTVLSRQGGMFDECYQVFKAFDKRVVATRRPMVFRFSSGATVSLSNYESDKSSETYRGIQLSSAAYDELTEAKESHVWTLISRLRSRSKYKSWFLGTCNPNADSWLLHWVKWYLYPEGHEFAGRPDPEKAGVVRYINNVGGKTVFTNTKQEMIDLVKEHTGEVIKDSDILSFTFIPATCYDNPPLLKAQPDYIAKLKSQPRVEVERLLMGNWFARQESEGMFRREWLGPLLPCPKTSDIKARVRAWDIAGTLKTEANVNPDWTVGVLMSKDKHGTFYIEDVIRIRVRFGELIDLIAKTAIKDRDLYGDVETLIPIEPAAHGKIAHKYNVDQLATYGVSAKGIPAGQKSKVTRFAPFSASSEVGSVKCVKAPWNDDFFYELETFDGSRNKKDDQVDAVAMAFTRLAQNKELPQFRLEVFTR